MPLLSHNTILQADIVELSFKTTVDESVWSDSRRVDCVLCESLHHFKAWNYTKAMDSCYSWSWPKDEIPGLPPDIILQAGTESTIQNHSG